MDAKCTVKRAVRKGIGFWTFPVNVVPFASAFQALRLMCQAPIQRLENQREPARWRSIGYLIDAIGPFTIGSNVASPGSGGVNNIDASHSKSFRPKCPKVAVCLKHGLVKPSRLMIAPGRIIAAMSIPKT